MLGTGLELLAILVLIVANGLFAMSEIAVVSARKGLLRQQSEEGSRSARIALELATAPSEFLSTVQVGITLIGTLAGAFGGTTIAVAFGHWLNGFRWMAPYGEPVAFATVVIGISYLSLILGELVPKHLALTKPEMVASAVAPSMRVLSKAGAPVVRLLGLSTDLVLRLLSVRHVDHGAVTEEEVSMLIAQAARTGAFVLGEEEMLEGVMRLRDRRIGELMTPRPNIAWLDVRASAADIGKTLAENVHSRYPVADGSLDRVLGIVTVKDMAARLLEGKPLDLRSSLRPAAFVPELTRGIQALTLFRKRRQQIALVVDEHGGVEGLITLADLVEAIIGEMPVPGERPEPDAVRRPDGSWLVDGMMPVFAFKQRLGIESLPGEDESDFTTVGGFVMARLGRVPAALDWFECDGRRYEVVDMDGRRVNRVIVSASSPAPGAA